jgi:hypothetical protein
MHPNTPTSEYSDYLELEDQNLCVRILPNSRISSYKLASHSFRNFSYGSTITWELIYADIHCAVIANSIGHGQSGIVELDTADKISDYLENELPTIDKSFPIMYADFIHNHGERHDFYKAETLHSGKLDFNLMSAK